MGMRDWLYKAKKIAQEQLTPEPTDPESVRKKKKEDAEKTFKMTTKAIKLAKQSMDGYKAASEKIDELTDAAAEKTLVIADKAKPLADKVDGAFDAAGDKAKGAFDFVKDKVTDGARAVTDGVPAWAYHCAKAVRSLCVDGWNAPMKSSIVAAVPSKVSK